MFMEDLIKKIFKEDISVKKFSSGAEGTSFLVSFKNEGKSLVVKFDIDLDIYINIVPELVGIGINIPDVLQLGKIENRSYVIMEYIPQRTMDEEGFNSEDIEEMGKILKQIHSIKGSGFGKIKKESLQGEYRKFSDYITNQFLDGKRYDRKKLERHLEIIDSYYSKNQEATVFCHMDFSLSNTIKYNEKYYVIDFGNESGFNYFVFDLVKVFINDFQQNFKKDFLKGYGDLDIDKDVLNSFVYIVGVRKIESWLRRGKDKKAELFKEFFREIAFD